MVSVKTCKNYINNCSNLLVLGVIQKLLNKTL